MDGITPEEKFKDEFYARLRAAIDASGMNDSQVSVALNPKAPGYVSNLFARRSSPQIAALASIASVLNVSTDHLLGLTQLVSVRAAETDKELNRISAALSQAAEIIATNAADDAGVPFIDSVLSWYRQSGGVLKSTDDLANYCDVYRLRVEEEIEIEPVHLGSSSVITQTLSEHNIQGVNDLIARADRTTTNSIKEWKLKAIQDHQVVLTTPELEIDLPAGGKLFLVYDKVELPLKSAQGHDLVLTFCRRISAKKTIPQFVTDV